MFTGLVEGVGRVVEASRRQGVLRLAVATPFPAAELQPGESISVEGVCLTVAARAAERVRAGVIGETERRTTHGGVRPGRKVNLERALRVGDRIGGHMVQGHVDAACAVVGLSRRGAEVRLRVELPPDLSRYVAPQGSICLSGVSLTVAAAGPDWVEAALIPETLERTTLGALRAGDRINLEVDLLARYLEKLSTVPVPPRGRVRRGPGSA